MWKHSQDVLVQYLCISRALEMHVTANFVMKIVQSCGGHLQGLTYTETLPLQLV